MTETPFHATRAGRTYYEVTLPKIAEELARINATLAALVVAVDKLAADDDDTDRAPREET